MLNYSYLTPTGRLSSCWELNGKISDEICIWKPQENSGRISKLSVRTNQNLSMIPELYQGTSDEGGSLFRKVDG